MALNLPNTCPILDPKINSNIIFSFNLLPLLPNFYECSVLNQSGSTQRGSVGQEEMSCCGCCTPCSSSAFHSRSSSISPLVFDAIPLSTQGMCSCGGRWTLIPGQHLTFHCLLKPRPTLCCHCSAFKQALSFWCLVQGFLFCLWVKILLTWESFVRVFIPLLDVPPTQHHLKWKD